VTNSTVIIVQASSRSWQGGTDLSMNPVDGIPAARYTANKFLSLPAQYPLIIAAPAFDVDGDFRALFADIVGDRCSLVFKCDDDPLQRLVEATQLMNDDDYIVRVDGLHFAVVVEEAEIMLQKAKDNKLDCVKFPDDFPVQLTSDIYRVGALRKLAEMPLDAVERVHPKYALFRLSEYKTLYHDPQPVSDEYLRLVRKQAESVYFIPRMDVNDKAADVGNQLTFHYHTAVKHLPRNSKVLDIACGDGYGSRYLAEQGHTVTGGDFDAEILVTARERSKGVKGIQFRHLNVMDIDAVDESFDAVVSMETVEHVDDIPYISEIHRILKPGGTFVLSTPQNSHGHIPVNAEHVREYSLEDIVSLCETKFQIIEKIGVKQGRVIVPGDLLGCNTMLVCQKT